MLSFDFANCTFTVVLHVPRQSLHKIKPLQASDPVEGFISGNNTFEIVALNNRRVDGVASAKEIICTHQVTRHLDFFASYRQRIPKEHQ
jgi:hypothetical protein